MNKVKEKWKLGKMEISKYFGQKKLLQLFKNNFCI